jgi:hypothetical protein
MINHFLSFVFFLFKSPKLRQKFLGYNETAGMCNAFLARQVTCVSINLPPSSGSDGGGAPDPTEIEKMSHPKTRRR